MNLITLLGLKEPYDVVLAGSGRNQTAHVQVAGLKHDELTKMSKKFYPQDQASASIAEHINQFWGRKMRTDFLAAFRADNPALHPLVAKALPHIKAASAP